MGGTVLTAMADQVQAEAGFYLSDRPCGFTAHLNASKRNLSRLRQLTDIRLNEAGIAPDLVDNAKLLVSELVGNAVQACGELAPLVAEVYTDPFGVWISVHDPDRTNLPSRPGNLADDASAEHGRGLFLLDTFAPGWRVILTPIGKLIRCRLPYSQEEMLSEPAGDQIPFTVAFDAQRRQLVVEMTYGQEPKQTRRHQRLASVEAIAISIAENLNESRLREALAGQLAAAAIESLGADPVRLREAVCALSEPTSTVLLGSILHGPMATGSASAPH
jgi:anti-sigma regulatory factor (Ser/Thr protein kinase)